jgi:two-component system, chemotaxis family, CheB/CheR fusion protein
MVGDPNIQDPSSTEPGPPDRGFFVVGIGASAGGVSALRQFFSHVEPQSDVAFVVIQHLSPQHESSLPALIQSQTSVPVTQVTEAVQVEPNHIYVIPPSKYLIMADGRIRLTEPEIMRGSHTSIDLFFRTLADAYGKDAMAILLSGAGTDGTFGLRRIKEAGGFVIAEDPAEAEYPEMPRSAIESGLVDLVLPVAEMADKVRGLRDGAQRLQLPSEQEEMTTRAADEVTLREILVMLRLRTGHDFAQYKRPTLMRRIARRMQVREVSYLTGYLNFLRDSPEELEALFRDLLITVTNFFRDHDGFEVLEKEVIPRLFEGKRPDDQVRVWSVGCATGEEAYSLAMLLSEYAARLPEAPRLQVFATDIDERAIGEGRDARYPATITLDITPERIQHFFVKEGDRYKIKKDLREMVLFAVHNVLRDPPFSKLDLISCRNLLIYLNREMQERILGIFHFALRPSGYLFLGASESAESSPSLFLPVDKKRRIYGRRPAQINHFITTDWITPRWQPPQTDSGRNNALGSVRSVGELHQEVVEQIAPPSVLINEDFDVVHMSAHVGRFLRFAGGEPTRNLLKLVHPDLRPDLHAALLEARTRESGGGMQSRRLNVELEGKPCWITLTVRHATNQPDAARGFYLVIFDQATAVAPMASATDLGEPGHGLDSITRLEEELQHTKEQLRLTIEQYETSTEELRASNEELQAINEELRSATEELETSKEELQSVNEELTTVNQEYREKIEEVGRANSDLQNLMASTDIGTIFLDRTLRIKRYTPRAQQLFNIVGADVGRPLQHFTNTLDYDSLPADAEEVLRTLQTIEREVHSSDGAWYLARLLPYRTLDDKIDGVVLTFVDITSRRQVEEQLRAQAARLREQAEIVDLGELFVRDADDRILLWSAGCERLYGYTRQEALGRNAHELLRTELPQPLAEINAVLEKNGQWEGELIHTGRARNRIVVVSRWVLHRPDENRPPLVLQVNNDITARRQAEEALRQADRNKDRFLGTLAHELRNPLAAMLNSVELLHRPARSGDEVLRASEVLQRQIQHLLRLVDDLLDVERLAHGKIVLQRKRERLSEIINSAMGICRPLINPNSHTFTVSLPSEPVTLEVDTDRIAQVIANLVHNAFKYTSPGGRIELAAEAENRELTIRVRDNGIGITGEALPHIFDMYTQGHDASRTELGGLGVGLALARQLVELHGGSVTAFSQGLQKGSEFIVRLPVVENAALGQHQSLTEVAAPTGASSESSKILIVDDHHDAANALGTLLQSSGHEVATCYDGPAALQKASSYLPQVVILDIGLPGMSGYEVARRLREMLPNAELIALSGWAADRNSAQATEAGFDHYIIKPVQIAELEKLLTKHQP